MIAKIPSKSMKKVVEALSLYISRNLSAFSVVRDYKNLGKALEALLFQSIVEKSGINSSFEAAAKCVLNRVKDDNEIGPIFRILTNLNDEMKAMSISFKDERLLRILVVESCRIELGENWYAII